ncbi:EamA family transporter RarD [Spirochaeta cellobiosiphila]|uniref:EamA family transporter RarD n=1 Tax=Spirochaeta cellobiosiphila TaxID=504483 RepID=UPI00041FF3B6|nr:EamA family transporter RarD [Spirochaeta cellobiosiphila]
MKKNIGYIAAASAYITWGLLPIYWKTLQSVPSIEILGHRIFWSFVLLLVLLGFKKNKAHLTYLRDKKKILTILTASIAITINWGVYIYSVTHDFIIEASLGYYINPLISVLLGVLILKEQLGRSGWVALLLATSGVIYQILMYKQFPWISLALAFSFGFYGLQKKRLKMSSQDSLFMETLMILPLALIIVILPGKDSALLTLHGYKKLLLILSGLATTVPLFLFAEGANRIPLTSIGFLQYITPTMTLILGVFLYKEPFDSHRLISFLLIWMGLLIYSIDIIHQYNKVRKTKS